MNWKKYPHIKGLLLGLVLLLALSTSPSLWAADVSEEIDNLSLGPAEISEALGPEEQPYHPQIERLIAQKITHGNYAWRFHRDYPLARAKFREALSLAPDHPLALFAMSHFHFGRGEFYDAAKTLPMAIAQRPQWHKDSIDLAELFPSREEYRQTRLNLEYLIPEDEEDLQVQSLRFLLIYVYFHSRYEKKRVLSLIDPYSWHASFLPELEKVKIQLSDMEEMEETLLEKHPVPLIKEKRLNPLPEPPTFVAYQYITQKNRKGRNEMNRGALPNLPPTPPLNQGIPLNRTFLDKPILQKFNGRRNPTFHRVSNVEEDVIQPSKLSPAAQHCFKVDFETQGTIVNSSCMQKLIRTFGRLPMSRWGESEPSESTGIQTVGRSPAPKKGIHPSALRTKREEVYWLHQSLSGGGFNPRTLFFDENRN
jgi:hypothetical protein